LADFKYDSGLGSVEIRPDLQVVGDDFWLTRENYDGSEWWRFNKFPVKPSRRIVPKSLSV